MYYSLGRLAAEQEKLAREKSAKAELTAIFLFRLSSILKSKAFPLWLMDMTSRFDWATDKIHRRLIKDLTFQVHQMYRVDRSDDNAESLQWPGIMADLVQELAETICTAADVKVLKKNRKVQTGSGREAFKAITEYLISVDTNAMDRDTSGSFYIWNSISSLMVYAHSRKTLAEATGDKVFEEVLAGLTEEYLLGGYPHDILAHDAREIRAGGSPKQLFMREGWCSTYLLTGKKHEKEAVIPTSFTCVNW